MKHVDEYHLTGISQDMFVQWERRPPSSADGRGESRVEARGDGKAKPEQIKLNDAQCSQGLVSLTVNLNSWGGVDLGTRRVLTYFSLKVPANL